MEHPTWAGPDWPHPSREVLNTGRQFTNVLDESGELEALIASMRTSAQDTLDALHRRGFKIVKA